MARSLLRLVSVLSILLAAAAIGGPGAWGAQSEPLPLKIGVQSVFSGEFSSYGDRQKGGILFALEKAEDLQVDGRPLEVELIYADDEGSAEKGPIAAQQLIDAGVDVVLGPGFSGPAAAAIPLFKEAGIPVVSPFTGADNLTDLGGGWYFRVGAPNHCQGEMLVRIAQAQGAQKVAVVDDNEAYGVDLTKGVTENANAAGLEITGEYHGAQGMTDWSPIIQRLQQDQPDLVIYNGYHAEAGRLVQQARDRGFTAPFLGSDGIADPGIFDVADPAKLTDLSAIGLIPTALVEGTASPEWEQFTSEYPDFAKSQGLSTTDADLYVADSFDATNLLLDAVQRAGSTDGQALADALRATTFEGLTGPFTYEANGEREGCFGTYFVLEGSEFKPQPIPGTE
jgi:branched-chain amino acid transport system substrate-binding protein